MRRHALGEVLPFEVLPFYEGDREGVEDERMLTTPTLGSTPCSTTIRSKVVSSRRLSASAAEGNYARRLLCRAPRVTNGTSVSSRDLLTTIAMESFAPCIPQFDTAPRFDLYGLNTAQAIWLVLPRYAMPLLIACSIRSANRSISSRVV